MANLTARGRIVVTDTETTAGLACVRDLGRAGYLVCASGVDPEPPAACSRYVSSYKMLPNPWSESDAYVEALLSLIRDFSADAVLPVSEASIELLRRYHENIPKDLTVLRAGEHILKYSLSKSATFNRALSLGIPVAEGQIIHCKDSPPEFAAHLFPMIVRTDNHWDSEGKYCKGQHWITHSPAELFAVLSELRARSLSSLVQKYYPGHGCGAFVLMNRGELLLWHTHERLAEVPWTGGVSARRKLTFDQELLTTTLRFLDGLSMTGIVMMEFRRTDQQTSLDGSSGGVHLIELNARPWGSLALAVHADIPFISTWARAQGLQPEWQSRYPMAARHGRTQKSMIVVTQIFPGEFQHLLSLLKSLRSNDISFLTCLKYLVRPMKVAFQSQMHFDYFMSDDPAPCLRQWQKFGSHVFQRVRDFFSDQINSARLYGTLIHLRIMRGNCWKQRTKPLGMKILVVCLGNRCRSPFVEKRLQRLLGSEYKIISRGMKVSSRTIPERFHGIFTEHQLNPLTHTATPLECHDLEWADAIILMERIHAARIMRQFRKTFLRKVRLLGEFDTSSGPLDILDPLIANPGRARREFTRLNVLTQNLAELICAGTDHEKQ